jgi:hypothetical protein
MNVGWWTPLCEEWYQRRLRQIHAGDAKLRSPSEWLSYMRTPQAKMAKKIHKHYDELAAEFLKRAT